MCLPMSDFIISFNIAYFPIFFFVDDIVFTLKTYQVKPALVLAAFILGLKMNDPEIAGLLSGWVNSPRGCNLAHNWSLDIPPFLVTSAGVASPWEEQGLTYTLTIPWSSLVGAWVAGPWSQRTGSIRFRSSGQVGASSAALPASADLHSRQCSSLSSQASQPVRGMQSQAFFWNEPIQEFNLFSFLLPVKKKRKKKVYQPCN